MSRPTYKVFIENSIIKILNKIASAPESTTIKETIVHKQGDANFKFKTTINVAQSEIPPTKEQLEEDLITFLIETGQYTKEILQSENVLDLDSSISLFYAINYFTEKALQQTPINLDDSTTFISYKKPSGLNYKPLTRSFVNIHLITKNKLNEIYSHLEQSTMLSDNGREIQVTSTTTCSSCSSSCSSAFIIYFNLV